MSNTRTYVTNAELYDATVDLVLSADGDYKAVYPHNGWYVDKIGDHHPCAYVCSPSALLLSDEECRLIWETRPAYTAFDAERSSAVAVGFPIGESITPDYFLAFEDINYALLLDDLLDQTIMFQSTDYIYEDHLIMRINSLSKQYNVANLYNLF